MTKERRIAIEMWKYIRDQYSQERVDDGVDTEIRIYNLKKGFLWEHGDPHWAYGCWFCQYIAKRSRPGLRFNPNGCKKCPLTACDSIYSPYRRLCNAMSQETWVEACNEIIIALGGTV